MRSPDDAALIGRDRHLPGLPLLLDDDAFAGALRTSCPGVKIDAVESIYIRYKPATSVLVGYRVRLDATTIGVHACGFAGAAEHRLRDAQRGASTPGPLGPGVLVLPEPMIVARTFPNDRRLGSLRRLGDDGRRAALLRRLLPEHEHLWTGDVRPLRHKPERRFVGAIEAGGEPRAVIRMYTPDDFGAAAHAARAFTGRGPLRVGSFLRRSKRHRTVALDWLDGAALTGLLGDASACRLTGAALACLHAQEPPLPRAWDTTRLEDELRTAALAIGRIAPPLGLRAGQIATTIARRLATHAAAPVAVHGDFGADQVVIDSDHAGIIDLDHAGWGDHRIDLGSFHARLLAARVEGELEVGVVETAIEALLDGYTHERHASVEAIEPFTAAALLRAAVEPFRRRQPRWSELVEAIVDEAGRISEAEVLT